MFMDCAVAQSAEPIVNIRMDASRTSRRPNKSASLPHIGRAAVVDKVYAVDAQAKDSDPCN